MDGGIRAGLMQGCDATDSVLITSTMGACSATGAWYKVEVISSAALFVSLTAPGLTNASLVTSGTTYAQGAAFVCSKITAVELSTENAAGMVVAHQKILL